MRADTEFLEFRKLSVDDQRRYAKGLPPLEQTRKPVNDIPRYMTVGEVMELLAMPRTTTMRWLKANNVAAVKFGKDIRVPHDDVLRAITG